MVMYANECYCLFVTWNSTNRPLIFTVFSYTGVYASPFGVRSTLLYLRLVVTRVLQLNFFVYTSLVLGLFVNDLSYFMIWEDTLFIHILNLLFCTFEHF